MSKVEFIADDQDADAEASSPVELPPYSKKPPRFDTCILHIGTEKTGTTALQHFLSLNRQTLRKSGIFYPKFNEPGSQWEFVTAAHDAPWNNIDLNRQLSSSDHGAQEQFRRKFAQNLEAQFQKAGNCSKLLISSEHFHSRLSTKQSVIRLKSFLENWAESFTVIVYFRRQDRVALSLSSTRVKSGLNAAPVVFPYGRKGAPRYYHYDDIFQMWSDVFGPDNMVARLYEDTRSQKNGLTADFCEILDLRHDGLKVPMSFVNASLSREAYYFLEELGRQAPKFVNGELDQDVDQIVRDLSELYPGKHYPVSRKQAQHFASIFRKRNERLRRMAFPDRPAPLFDQDFSEYPEEAEPRKLTTEEAVEIALALTRRARERYETEPAWKVLARKWLKKSPKR